MNEAEAKTHFCLVDRSSLCVGSACGMAWRWLESDTEERWTNGPNDSPAPRFRPVEDEFATADWSKRGEYYPPQPQPAYLSGGGIHNAEFQQQAYQRPEGQKWVRLRPNRQGYCGLAAKP